MEKKLLGMSHGKVIGYVSLGNMTTSPVGTWLVWQLMHFPPTTSTSTLKEDALWEMYALTPKSQAVQYFRLQETSQLY